MLRINSGQFEGPRDLRRLDIFPEHSTKSSGIPFGLIDTLEAIALRRAYRLISFAFGFRATMDFSSSGSSLLDAVPTAFDRRQSHFARRDRKCIRFPALCGVCSGRGADES